MSIATIALFCQLALLGYHQLTTLCDLYPFNGARHLKPAEKWAECGVNGLLMILPPTGFAFHVRWLMTFGVIYYAVLFAIELIIWWVPYLGTPSGRWRAVYNWLLAAATSNFEKGDTLAHWEEIHDRLYRGTISVLPRGRARIVPNLEHTILHGWTFVTAIVTAAAWHSSAA
jgi:hypothetical protein